MNATLKDQNTASAEIKKFNQGRGSASAVVGALEICLGHIRAAGGVPNSRFASALRAARQLDAECAKADNAPKPEGSDYRIVASNGREFVRFVPKGGDIFALARQEQIDMVSFSKV